MEASDYIELLQNHDLLIRAPGRINLIGEHTDYNLGLCMPAAIEESIYLGISHSTTMAFHALDRQESWDGKSATPPDWAHYISGILNLANASHLRIEAFRLEFGGTLASGAGLSSSSAISCGICKGLNELFEWNLSPLELTRFAVRAESHSGLLGGMMDQISIISSLADHAMLIHCDDWSYEFLPVHLKDAVWIVVDTAVKHRLVDSDYNNRSLACRSILQELQSRGELIKGLGLIPLSDQEKYLHWFEGVEQDYLKYQIEENERVKKFREALLDQDHQTLGKLLIRGHEGLRDLYRVSCPELDFLIGFAEQHPASYGARMMGGGFGGSSIHLVKAGSSESYMHEIKEAYRKQFPHQVQAFPAKMKGGLDILHP